MTLQAYRRTSEEEDGLASERKDAMVDWYSDGQTGAWLGWFVREQRTSWMASGWTYDDIYAVSSVSGYTDGRAGERVKLDNPLTDATALSGTEPSPNRTTDPLVFD